MRTLSNAILGTLLLGDGRRIQPAHFPQSERTIQLHPEFRIIMLANRCVKICFCFYWPLQLLVFEWIDHILFSPGFPFLGNDLFGVLGDLFSVHTVDNPSRDSEISMLRQYAPGKIICFDYCFKNCKHYLACLSEGYDNVSAILSWHL